MCRTVLNSKSMWSVDPRSAKYRCPLWSYISLLIDLLQLMWSVTIGQDSENIEHIESKVETAMTSLIQSTTYPGVLYFL